ncbi:MAG: gluconate 2-dehydrogenase subunit 3 family protein [Pseudomonadota bacterium]|nr:gluconate 2-dehydrogenase subunit 3 family protein [Pseudomonadota bacterium]
MNRREALLAVAVGIASATAFPSNAQQRLDSKEFAYVCDVFLPADLSSASASQLGAADEVLELVLRNPLLTRLIASGLEWLNQVQQTPFENLSVDQQEAILAWAEQSDFNQVPGRFFHVLRAMLFEVYFSKPEALAGLPLNAAPQPEGYLPPWT